VFKNKKLRKTKNVADWEKEEQLKKSMVEIIQQIQKTQTQLEGLSTSMEIHVHGRMKHNLAKYAKYCSCGSTKILKGSEFTREIDHNKRDFSKHW
jgi:hypothetical protein